MSRLEGDFRRALLALACALVTLLSRADAGYAQEGSTPVPPAGTTTIHVVQRDESLFGIALRYGTTVEAIAEANGIGDVRYIAIGQRLLIPNAQSTTPGDATVHILQPGDSLRTLVDQYQVAAESLAASNYLTNPALLYIGQQIVIPQGASDSASGPQPELHHVVQPGQNIFRIAIMYNVPVQTLIDANDLAWPAPLFFGQTLRIPGAPAPDDLSDLPYPLVAARFSSVPAVQGKTLSIHLETQGNATLSGTFMDRELHFATHDGNQHDALFGIHAMAEPAIYPMALTIHGANGFQTTAELRVEVVSGGYYSEQIMLTAELNDLLDPLFTQPEEERVARIASGWTATRYFDGMMGLPSTGSITSQFGTRRSYNNGALFTFHAGADFGGAPGSLVVAPAAGVVVMTEKLPVRGNATLIDHGWGVYSGFWHQSRIDVQVGDVVTAGQVIGTIGTTGRSTGPHLHWELWVGGAQVDPLQWAQEAFP